MSTACLKHSFRRYSGPVLFLTVVCLILGAFLVRIEPSMGGAFVVAAMVALVVFTLLGAQGGCGDRS